MKFTIEFDNGDLLRSDIEYHNICAWNIQKFEQCNEDQTRKINVSEKYGNFGMSEKEKIEMLIKELEFIKGEL